MSLISKSTLDSVFPSIRLDNTEVSLHTYTLEAITVLGQLTVEVCYNGYTGTHQLYVVEGCGPGRDWLAKIRLDWAGIRTETPRAGSMKSLQSILLCSAQHLAR